MVEKVQMMFEFELEPLFVIWIVSACPEGSGSLGWFATEILVCSTEFGTQVYSCFVPHGYILLHSGVCLINRFDLSERQTSSSSKEEMNESRRLQVVSKLHHILRPFLLRRLKKDVEKTLPLKKEIILYTPMTPQQKEFHDHLINKTLNEYFEDRSNYPGAQLKSKLNNVVIQLRKNCNHPDLFTSQFGDSCNVPGFIPS
jgi:hypothetical protein